MASQAGQRLSGDHRAVNEVLKQLLTALDNKNVEASYRKLDLLWARLAVHIRAEHLHLFPTLVNCLTGSIAGAPGPDLSEAQTIIAKLRADHDFFMRELARAVGILRDLPRPLDIKDEARWTAVVDIVLSVKTRLENHNELEENQLYGWSDTILPIPEQIDLAARINAELEHHPPRFSAEDWVKEL